MNRQQLWSSTMRLAVASLCVLTASGCGSEMLRTGRSPMFLTVNQIATTNGASDDVGTNLLSDVQTMVEQTIDGVAVQVPTIFNDTAVATLGLSAKNPSAPTSVINSVTITNYRIVFKRTDGRNTPGVDVPFGWDGQTSVTIQAGGTGDVVFEIVRHSTKQEPPLRNLINNGGVQFIYTIAEITFFGRDQNGNEVSATGHVDVAFSDFGDPQ